LSDEDAGNVGHAVREALHCVDERPGIGLRVRCECMQA
jgi:hypothetical protein